MQGARTRGQPAALAAVGSMIRGGAPHAVLLVGPAGIGKTTLALDLAAGLLCTADDVDARPCGACRACRLVAAGAHSDLHRIGPEGPGRQVVIGGQGARARGVRDLIGELALRPIEGGARIAIIEAAHRMNEDAQAALLKTLEEPPAGVTLILCADAEEPLLPTIRSRCARLRLGPVGTRDVEAILGENGVADAPLAARLARIAGGRPGLAIAWAREPNALRARDELSRIPPRPPRRSTGGTARRRAGGCHPGRLADGRGGAGRRRFRPSGQGCGQPVGGGERGHDRRGWRPPTKTPDRRPGRRPPNGGARRRPFWGCGPTSRGTSPSAVAASIGRFATSACSTRRRAPPRGSTPTPWTPSSTGSAAARS